MFIPPYRNDLNQIVVLNPKGGCGKTTLATNLASSFALRGSSTMLIDNDPSGFTSRWLEKRPESSSRIHGVGNHASNLSGERSWRLSIPDRIDTLIIDTPAALDRHAIYELTRNADCILIPILPSAFDSYYSTKFIAELLLLTQFEKPVAVIANRTRQNTRSLATLIRKLDDLETPTIGVLRNSQNYVRAADLGLSIYELPHYMAKKDLEQMDLIVDWVDRLLVKTWEPAQNLPGTFLSRLFSTSTRNLLYPDKLASAQ